MSIRRALSAAIPLMLVAGSLFVATTPAAAGIYPAESGTVYKEYWVPHATWTGGCVEHGLYKPKDAWYLEPGPCTKTITFNIPDNVSRVDRVEMYLDLWRNYTGVMSARVKLNGGPVRQPMVGFDWSRTPHVIQIPVGELRQGTNTMVFTAAKGRFHVHDIAFRVYHSAAKPLVAGPGSDITPPNANLTSVAAANGSFAPGAGGTLQVNNDQVNFAATADGAARVEFHAFYDGYDTDNDGLSRDWHAFNRNNWNPGGVKTKGTLYPTGPTLGIPGADLTAPYAVTWRLPHVINQTGVRFKVRAVDAAGNVRETVASGAFGLTRTFTTTKHLIAGFVDFPLHGGGKFPQVRTATITLPSLAGVQSAFLVGHFWQNPNIKVNGGTQFRAFTPAEDPWDTSVKQIPVSQLRAGANTITYTYNPLQIGYGQFVERPGPMIVLRGGPAAAGAADDTGVAAIESEPDSDIYG